jgi:hypothetical protein
MYHVHQTRSLLDVVILTKQHPRKYKVENLNGSLTCSSSHDRRTPKLFLAYHRENWSRELLLKHRKSEPYTRNHRSISQPINFMRKDRQPNGLQKYLVAHAQSPTLQKLLGIGESQNTTHVKPCPGLSIAPRLCGPNRR